MFGSDNTQAQPTNTQVTMPAAPALMNDPLPDFSSLSLPQDPTTVNTAPLPSDQLPQIGPVDQTAQQAPTSDPQQIIAPINTNEDSLLAIKKEAMEHLTPLVGHLEQTPEEKFRTTMMMIQASDNQSLVKDAFAAAKEIVDDKARAQALLDVINEINYFTQQHA